jgi:broad specificity phosphatase PhoE
MSSLVLIPWASTAWSESGRLAATTQLPLSDGGRAQAAEWGDQLADRVLARIYTGDEQTAKETADVIATGLKAKVKTLAGLEEQDRGLWEGLTESDLENRFPKAYKRWKADPALVCPPEGESVEAVGDRLARALRTLRRKSERSAVGVVLGPVALAVARCALEGLPLENLRDRMVDSPVWYDNLEEPVPVKSAGTEG